MDEHTVVGTIALLENIYSPQLDNHRDIYVYLPPSYEPDGDRYYPVIYMHDGQNLFDQLRSFSGEWQVDETMEELAEEGIEAIVVGVPNGGQERLDECCPFPNNDGADSRGDTYLDFIVETVKPLIDANFCTLPDREATGMVGSSMGGLITLYAFFRYPEIFGFAGVMSPALWFADKAIFDCLEELDYVPGKLYLDIGTGEEEEAVTHAREMLDLLLAKGYEPGDDFLFVEEDDAPHSEDAWANRLHLAVRFLLPCESVFA